MRALVPLIGGLVLMSSAGGAFCAWASAEVWLAITESGLASDVVAGENAGHRLVHAPIVRALRKAGVTTTSSLHLETDAALDPAWAPRALHFVAFVQRARSRHIVGATSI